MQWSIESVTVNVIVYNVSTIVMHKEALSCHRSIFEPSL